MPTVRLDKAAEGSFWYFTCSCTCAEPVVTESGSAQEMAKQPPKTRASASVYGLGYAVSKDDLHLPKSKLPTVRLILKALKYLAAK